MKLLEDLKNCISNNEKDEKADNINQKMMFDMNEINNMMMLENIQINRNFEKIPKRISSNFKEILAIVMRKQEIFKKKLPINLKGFIIIAIFLKKF